jgi:hypothetical protein
MSAANYYFVGGEREAFIKYSDAGIAWSTTSGTYDSNFSRGSVKLDGGTAPTRYIATRLSAAQTECWHSFRRYHEPRSSSTGGMDTSSAVEWLDSNLTPIFRIKGVGGTAYNPLIQAQYWNGTTWVAAGDPEICPANIMHKFDLYHDILDAAGTVRWYLDGRMIGELTGDTKFTADGDVREVRNLVSGSDGAGGIIYLSEWIARDLTTLGRRLATLPITGAGAGNAWTSGTYADLDEAGTYSDTDYMASETADQVATFVTTDLSATAALYDVEDVINAFRAQIGGTGPQNLKGAVRVGGTNYFSPANVAPSLVTDMDYAWAVHPENPATTAAWTAAEINTAGFETGLKSIT